MKQRIVLLTCLLFLTGCLPALMTTPSNRLIGQSWQATNIEDEIVKQEILSQSNADSFFILALLYTHPRNQSPDYSAAKTSLDKYIESLPKGHQTTHPTTNKHWQADYIYHLLDRVNATTEEVGRTKRQLDAQRADHFNSQTDQKACQAKLKAVQTALNQSKKKSRQALDQLKKSKALSSQNQDDLKRLTIDNAKLKKQLEELTKLYLDLEKKRQAIQ